MSDENISYASRHKVLENPVVHETQYLQFVWQLGSITRKTEVWYVKSKNRGHKLGAIQWYGPWRCYVLYPLPGTLFNAQCLKDIQEFITAQMEERRADH